MLVTVVTDKTPIILPTRTNIKFSIISRIKDSNIVAPNAFLIAISFALLLVLAILIEIIFIDGMTSNMNNIIGIPLAAGVWIPLFGWQLNPMFGAAAMSLSSFCVVTNALRLNFKKI